MATAKDQVRQLLESLPDDASLEDVQYSIYVRERIARARKEADSGELIDQDEIASGSTSSLDCISLAGTGMCGPLHRA